MNIKQRVKAAINFKPVDRIPTMYRGIDYLTKSLMKHFGFGNDSKIEKNYKELLKNMGADLYSTGYNPGYFSTFVPECSYPEPELPYAKSGSFFYALDIKTVFKSLDEYQYTYAVYDSCPPLADIESEKEVKKDFLVEKLKHFDFNTYHQIPDFKLKKMDILSYDDFKDNYQDFICIGVLNEVFMICCYLRGMKNFLEDFAFNKRLAERVIEEVGNFCIQFNKCELEGFGNKAEWYAMWDDVAGQYGMMFDPVLFKKYFLPIYKKIIENTKKHNLIFSWHCCGNVNDILPLMIDAGIDVFDVVQTSAKDMEIENVYKRYGRDICLHGGIDVQKLLPFGKPKDIKNEVKKIMNLWGRNGGIILGPSHEALPETPVENILAIYEEIGK